MMQHQFWVTKKSVQRKLGGKEDECIISSDAELDAKLELFRSVSDNCIQLQRIIDLYQERLCLLAQEENALGRYLKECGKNEKNASAGQIMAAAGKALAYTGHQRLTIRPPLVRLHHEVDTFRGRAVSDTRVTVVEMEKARTEYRAALSWMKSVSSQLDPDTGHGLERFRKAQTYVKSSKARFDRLMLACLQKVDLLAAARCNMFSHALISYQNAISIFSSKSSDTLSIATAKLKEVEPYEFHVISELTPLQDEKEDKDKQTFFNAEYKDDSGATSMNKDSVQNMAEQVSDDPSDIGNLLGDDFFLPSTGNPEIEENKDGVLSNVALLERNLCNDADILRDFMPSSLIQEGNFNFNFNQQEENFPTGGSTNITKERDTKNVAKKVKNDAKTESQVSWLSLFKELDPLSNTDDGIMSIDKI